MISDTKIEVSSLEQQFNVKGFNITFSLNRNRYNEGLLLYFRNNVNAVLQTSYVFHDNIKAFFIEIHLKSCR